MSSPTDRILSRSMPDSRIGSESAIAAGNTDCGPPERAPDVLASGAQRSLRCRSTLDRSSLRVVQRDENNQREVGRFTQVDERMPSRVRA